MSSSSLDDAFAHHVWATLRLMDTCLALGPEQLETAVPGTYGSILDTQRHLVGADASYLSVTSADPALSSSTRMRWICRCSGLRWRATDPRGRDFSHGTLIPTLCSYGTVTTGPRSTPP